MTQRKGECDIENLSSFTAAIKTKPFMTYFKLTYFTECTDSNKNIIF